MISPATPVSVMTEASRVVLRVEADAIEAVFPFSATGLIDSVKVGDQPNVVFVALNRQAGAARTAIATADNTTRVVIEVPMAEARPATPDSNFRPPILGFRRQSRRGFPAWSHARPCRRWRSTRATAVMRSACAEQMASRKSS